MATEKQFKALADKRSVLIERLISQMEKKAELAERILLRNMISDFVDKLDTDDEGRIKATLRNKMLLASVDKAFDSYGNTAGLDIAKTIAEGVRKIADFNNSYYQLFTTKAQLLPLQAQAQETLSAWLGITNRGKVEENGYLNKLVKLESFRTDLKNMALNGVISRQGWRETKQAFTEFLSETRGRIKSYYRNFVYDTYSKVDRATGQIYADKLQLQYAIFEGPKLKTSRKWCLARKGKVFSREEIQKFNPGRTAPPNYNPFTDLGGFGCIDVLNWIPENVAFAMRPDLRPAS